ncbi:hypothetical protein Sdagh_48640 [Streptomyces daghestanicus]|uniref:Uncharacterized protein n=1 Tax=Streptomyces daghestanicus TaxID=66885 RepID=A0ABQ3Q771_9ACTN|nr:hypothetical protein Sdagh_48640 [Streptomyces daghestanicus]
MELRGEPRGLSRAAVRLDAPAVREPLGAAVDRHGLSTAWQEVTVPAPPAVGRAWETSGDRYVEVEHLLSWDVSIHAAPPHPPPPPPRAAPPRPWSWPACPARSTRCPSGRSTPY